MNLDLSADIATGLLREASARGLSVDELTRKALAAYQRDLTGASTVRRVGRTNREAEVKWFLHPDPQFVGK